jgi:hypothetical protein
VIIISNSKEEVEILSQLVIEEQLEQAPKPRFMEEVKLQQLANKDSGEEFIQKVFEEEPICNVIPQCPRSRTKTMMK